MNEARQSLSFPWISSLSGTIQHSSRGRFACRSPFSLVKIQQQGEVDMGLVGLVGEVGVMGTWGCGQGRGGDLGCRG